MSQRHDESRPAEVWSRTLSLAICMLPLSHAAVAQDELQEVIVTGARGREEDLQKVPVSATVFGEAALRDANITTAEDFLSLAPGVTFAESQDQTEGFITIRGLSRVRNSESPVAVVVDGVLQVHPAQFEQELFDIESIEVLRGPQGALYGRNAAGGAIILNTRKPTNELEGFVEAGYATGNEKSIAGSISGPLRKDNLLFRLSARRLDRDGYFDNLLLGVKQDPVTDTTVRGLLTAKISDNFSANFRAAVIRSTGAPITFQWQAYALDPATGVPTLLGFVGDHISANKVDRNFFSNNRTAGVRDLDELSVRLNWLTEAAAITSTTAFTRLKVLMRGDAAPYSVDLAEGAQHAFESVDAWSQELRFSSREHQRLQWMTGAYVLVTDRFRGDHTTEDLGRGIGFYYRAPSINPDNPNRTFFGSDNHNLAYAGFANLTFDLTERIELYGGLRYDQEDRERTTSPHSTSGLPPGCAFGSMGNCVDETSFSAWQPKVSLTATATDNITVYGSWARGFRSGQFNNSGTAAAAANAFPPLPGVSDIAKAEDTETFEIGLKSQWFGRALTLNAAIYDTRVENSHYYSFLPAIGAQVISNIDETSLRGFELESVLTLSPAFSAYASYSYIDSEIKAFTLQPADVGNEAPYVARDKVNVGAQYRGFLNEGLGYFLRADFERRGRQYWQTDNLYPRDPLDFLKLRAGIEDPNGGWSFAVSAENATNVEYLTEFCCGGFVVPGSPRVWRADVRVDF